MIFLKVGLEFWVFKFMYFLFNMYFPIAIHKIWKIKSTIHSTLSKAHSVWKLRVSKMIQSHETITSQLMLSDNCNKHCHEMCKTIYFSNCGYFFPDQQKHTVLSRQLSYMEGLQNYIKNAVEPDLLDGKLDLWNIPNLVKLRYVFY